jgi:hypothetical protein
VIVVVFDSWFLDIDLPVLLQTGKIDISALAQPLIAQGFAFLAVFMGLLLLRRLISFGSIRFEGIPSSLRKTWNWARFLVVSLGLTVFGGWFTAWSLSPYAESLEVIRLPKSFLGIEEVSPPLLTAMAVSTTVAVLTFRPPGYRDIETRLITWRLVLLIAAGGLTLWTYRLFGSADQFFLFAGTAFGLTIALTFAQRALS